MFLPCPRCGFLVALIAPRSSTSQRCPRCGNDLPSADDVEAAQAAAVAKAPPPARVAPALQSTPMQAAPAAADRDAVPRPASPARLVSHAIDAEAPEVAPTPVLQTSPRDDAMPGGAPEPYDVTPYAQVPQRAAATAVPDAGSAPQEVDHRRETVPLATLDSTATSPDSRSAPLLDDTRALRASSQAPQASAVLHASSEAPTADTAAQPQAPAGSISSARLLDAHDAADAGSSVAAASSAASPTERDARAEDALDVRDATAAAHETDRDARLGAAATPEADLPPVETTVADKPVATAELAAADVAANEPTARPRSATPSFARRRGRLTTLRAWPLYVASVVLALVLALQLLLAQRAELAADAGSRPLVLNVCGVLRCSVPAWHEPSAFNMLQRNVLPRRGAPGQLAVDARFRNDARWPQAWPTLVLTLAGVDGQPIAARAFKPADYLPARHAPLIDAGQSAQVQLNVLEPGPGVVAFTFEFR